MIIFKKGQGHYLRILDVEIYPKGIAQKLKVSLRTIYL